jgi:hypothetical protein
MMDRDYFGMLISPVKFAGCSIDFTTIAHKYNESAQEIFTRSNINSTVESLLIHPVAFDQSKIIKSKVGTDYITYKKKGKDVTVGVHIDMHAWMALSHLEKIDKMFEMLGSALYAIKEEALLPVDREKILQKLEEARGELLTELGGSGKQDMSSLTSASISGTVISTPAETMPFEVVPPDPHYSLVIQYGLSGDVDLKFRHMIEDIAEECLAKTQNGYCDGGDIGHGKINIFNYVKDPILAEKPILEALRLKGVLEDAVLAVREPEEDDYKVIWPANYDEEFSLF